MALLLETCWGDIVIDLDVEGSPSLCQNVLLLATIRYYSNTLVFNVVPNRFCQLGDPKGDGTGGKSIHEILQEEQEQEKSGVDDGKNADDDDSHHRIVGRPLTEMERRQKGRVAVAAAASSGGRMGSQFLITLSEGPDRALDGYTFIHNITADHPTKHLNDDGNVHNVTFYSLGVVSEDEHGVLDKINAAYCDPKGRPYADIRIQRALVIHDPFFNNNDHDPMAQRIYDYMVKRKGITLADPSSDNPPNGRPRRVLDSPSPPPRPPEEVVEHRISCTEVPQYDDLLNEEIYDNEEENEEKARQRRMRLLAEQEEMARHEARSRAVVLEMLGDIPDADITAPENVLFICKLNPVTVDEDLELIFSRFDPRVRVEIVRDRDTGASLQYAFAEFTRPSAAEEAYLKMNNALVDDRRIKVDFSQSVAKLWDKYRQQRRQPSGRPFSGGSSDTRRGSSKGQGTLDEYRRHDNNRMQNRSRSPRDRRDGHGASKRYREFDDFGRSQEYRQRQQRDPERDHGNGEFRDQDRRRYDNEYQKKRYRDGDENGSVDSSSSREDNRHKKKRRHDKKKKRHRKRHYHDDDRKKKRRHYDNSDDHGNSSDDTDHSSSARKRSHHDRRELQMHHSHRR
jgi:peptidyl-prolyl cis-trans isomerase-like 4